MITKHNYQIIIILINFERLLWKKKKKEKKKNRKTNIFCLLGEQDSKEIEILDLRRN